MALTKEAHHILQYVEMMWNLHDKFPDIEQIVSFVNSPANKVKPPLESALTREECTRLIAHDEDLHKSFELRGIKWDIDTGYDGLTEEQLAVAAVVLDYTDKRPLGEKLKKLGIPQSQYRGWQRSKVFREYIKTRSEQLFSDGLPEAHAALMKRVNEGDIKAIKLFYEMAGRWSSRGPENDLDLKVLMTRIIEIIQVNVQDAKVRSAVATDLGKLLSGSMGNLAQPKEIEYVNIDQ